MAQSRNPDYPTGWNIFTYESSDRLALAKSESESMQQIYSDYLSIYDPNDEPAFSAHGFSRTSNRLAETELRNLVHTKLGITLSDQLDFRSEAERLMFVLKFG